MASSFLTAVAAVTRAIEEGVQAVTTVSIDTSDSSALFSADYDVLAQELRVQFRRRRRKLYVYPMGPVDANRFANARSKGRFLATLSAL